MPLEIKTQITDRLLKKAWRRIGGRFIIDLEDDPLTILDITPWVLSFGNLAFTIDEQSLGPKVVSLPVQLNNAHDLFNENAAGNLAKKVAGSAAVFAHHYARLVIDMARDISDPFDSAHEQRIRRDNDFGHQHRFDWGAINEAYCPNDEFDVNFTTAGTLYIKVDTAGAEWAAGGVKTAPYAFKYVDGNFDFSVHLNTFNFAADFDVAGILIQSFLDETDYLAHYTKYNSGWAGDSIGTESQAVKDDATIAGGFQNVTALNSHYLRVRRIGHYVVTYGKVNAGDAWTVIGRYDLGYMPRKLRVGVFAHTGANAHAFIQKFDEHSIICDLNLFKGRIDEPRFNDNGIAEFAIKNIINDLTRWDTNAIGSAAWQANWIRPSEYFYELLKQLIGLQMSRDIDWTRWWEAHKREGAVENLNSAAWGFPSGAIRLPHIDRERFNIGKLLSDCAGVGAAAIYVNEENQLCYSKLKVYSDDPVPSRGFVFREGTGDDNVVSIRHRVDITGVVNLCNIRGLVRNDSANRGTKGERYSHLWSLRKPVDTNLWRPHLDSEDAYGLRARTVDTDFAFNLDDVAGNEDYLNWKSEGTDGDAVNPWVLDTGTVTAIDVPPNHVDLIDTTKDFVALGVQVNDYVLRQDTGEYTKVTAVAVTRLTTDSWEYYVGMPYVVGQFRAWGMGWVGHHWVEEFNLPPKEYYIRTPLSCIDYTIGEPVYVYSRKEKPYISEARGRILRKDVDLEGGVIDFMVKVFDGDSEWP